MHVLSHITTLDFIIVFFIIILFLIIQFFPISTPRPIKQFFPIFASGLTVEYLEYMTH